MVDRIPVFVAAAFALSTIACLVTAYVSGGTQMFIEVGKIGAISAATALPVSLVTHFSLK